MLVALIVFWGKTAIEYILLLNQISQDTYKKEDRKLGGLK